MAQVPVLQALVQLVKDKYVLLLPIIDFFGCFVWYERNLENVVCFYRVINAVRIYFIFFSFFLLIDANLLPSLSLLLYHFLSLTSLLLTFPFSSPLLSSLLLPSPPLLGIGS
jgi:hypothetical protein